MIVVYRNFFRNKMVNLSYLSVRKFLPFAKVFCVSLYKESPADYDNQEPLNSSITNYFVKTEFVSGNDTQDDIDSTKTSGYQNPDNGKYFAEGYNIIFQLFKSVDEKILMLSEDHFFTNGSTIKELTNNDFDLAYAPWDLETDANGSILCVNFSKLCHLFPLPYTRDSIEKFLQIHLVSKVPSHQKHRITTRKHADYFGDGIYTNSSEVMTQELIKARLL